MSFNSWGLNLPLNLFNTNEILQKVLPCTFLDFVSVPVKSESRWSEWKMKTVHHKRHLEWSCDAESKVTVFHVPSWALIPVTPAPLCSLVFGLCHSAEGTLGALQSSVWNALAERNVKSRTSPSCSLPAPECTQSFTPVNAKNTEAVSLQKLKQSAILCLKKKPLKSSLSQFCSLPSR